MLAFGKFGRAGEMSGRGEVVCSLKVLADSGVDTNDITYDGASSRSTCTVYRSCPSTGAVRCVVIYI